MVQIKVDEEILLDVLMNRISFWTKDKKVQKLFEDMYSSYIENGLFEGMEFDVQAIVDNDYVNYCKVLKNGCDAEYEQVLELAEQSKYDISCETCFSFVEAISDDKKLILVRV